MLLNEHQLRLWDRMLQSIESFRKGELQYFNLVYDLEGALDAGEFKDEKLIKQWYDFWLPLELWNASILNSDVTGYVFNIEDVNQDISNMESFLKSVFTGESL